MDADWIKSSTARRILLHWADRRPAWLWSGDGSSLLWRNISARYFYGKMKKNGIKLSPDAAPIKGQIPRVLRMGTLGRSSLSRLQFLVGEKPVSATCQCTPLKLADDQIAVLVVGVDPIDAPLLREPMAYDSFSEGFLPLKTEHLLLDEDGLLAGGSPDAVALYAPLLENNGLPQLDAEGTGSIELNGQEVTLTRFKASPGGASLLLFAKPSRAQDADAQPAPIQQPEAVLVEEPGTALEKAYSETVLEEWSADEADEIPTLPVEPEAPPIDELDSRFPPEETELLESDEPMLSEATMPLTEAFDDLATSDESRRSLTALFDKLLDDEQLFAPLGAGDDRAPVSASEAEKLAAAPEETRAAAPEVAEEQPAVPAEAPDQSDPETPSPQSQHKPTLHKIIGRGFKPAISPSPEVPDENSPNEGLSNEGLPVEQPIVAEPHHPAPDAGVDEPAAQEAEAAPEPVVAVPPDSESVERVSRYNFDELSRILNDRVGNDGGFAPRIGAGSQPPASGIHFNTPVALGGEAFVLNRLSLGILVFRDQQVLFANRALTDLTGYESIESLRASGIDAIFPAVEAVAGGAGPLHHLVRRDGVLVPVNARIQTISWHGKSAVMLSASLAESTLGHEAAVRTFAEVLADASEDGFVGADRSGTISVLSGHASVLLGRPAVDLVGHPLLSIIAPGDNAALKAFLERPARFAETARPGISLSGTEKGVEILLFAEGQAGIVAGYFGFVRRRPMAAEPSVKQQPTDVEPGLLARISRGVRRPLNSILGFADLIASGDAGNNNGFRYREYAGDIKEAGQEIAALVGELDDYARLREGRYVATEIDTNLGTLLEATVGRVRSLANERRVLVRSAVSERLPQIKADRLSLTQAMLNLLASAIDQTPAGGSVVLSAKWADDGGIDVHVRSSASLSADLPDQFVVFRDGVGRSGEPLGPVRSSVGLALTRALLAVNSCSLSVDPTAGAGTLFSILIQANLVIKG
jgi:signal transduction histidine kinase/PAS domain-containing protein